jgi:hypothetical protein
VHVHVRRRGDANVIITYKIKKIYKAFDAGRVQAISPLVFGNPAKDFSGRVNEREHDSSEDEEDSIITGKKIG